MLAAFLLTFLGVQASAASVQPSKAEVAIALLKQHCLLSGTMDEKTAQLVKSGWSNQATNGSFRFAHEGPLRAFGNQAFPQMVMMLTAPATEPNRVADCVVDGQDINVRDLIKSGVKEFGKPEQRGEAVFWNLAQLNRSIIAAPSKVLNNKNEDAAFMLLVRFGSLPSVGNKN
jgi:hypothetical protein